MQEIDAKDVAAVARAAELPYHAHFRAYGTEVWRKTGVAVFSRWPIKLEDLCLGAAPLICAISPGSPSACRACPWPFTRSIFPGRGLVDKRGKGLIKEIFGGGARSIQMESIIKQLRKDNYRFRVLAGDLNTFPMSGPYRLSGRALKRRLPRACFPRAPIA